MAGQCWACRRQARGLGHSDNRFRVGEARRYPMDWVFCSRKCQDAFHALYGQWLRTDPRQEDVLMVDPTEFERAAMRACLKCFGEAAGEIGFDKPLGQYSEAEALQVIEAIVTGWTEAMAAHHQQAKYPPVRGIAPYETQAPQPVAKLEPSPGATAFDPANPFADLEDDLPWETGEVRRHMGVDAAHAYGGFMAHLTAWCEHHQIPYQGVPVGTIKKHATGKGNAGKAEMIAAAKARGFDPVDDNHADALALLDWAMAQGGVA